MTASTPATGPVDVARTSRRSSPFGWVVPALVASVCALAVLGVGMHLGRSRLHVPMSLAGDALFYLAQSKSTFDHGWWWWNGSLGAPFGLNALAFPSNSNVDQALVWAASQSGLDFPAVINLAWVGAVGLSAATATYALMSLGASGLVAAMGGILFALSPFAMYRNLGHFSLVTYLVPFPAAAALRLALPPAYRRPGPVVTWPLVIGCALVGLNYVYYAFFGCLLIGTAAVIALVAFRRLRDFGAGLALIAVVVTFTALNLAPSVAVWAKQGPPLIVRQKVAAEADVYGMKVRHLVSPVAHARWPLSWWAAQEKNARFPLETENAWSRLGVVTAAGFLLALGALLTAPSGVVRQWLPLGPGLLCAVAVLFATVGGFGSIFNLLVTPEIRGLNRITPFIAFFGVAFGASLLDELRKRFPVPGTVTVAAILVLGLWDQTAPLVGLAQQHAQAATQFATLRSDVARIERALPSGAAVLQLPFTVYLNDPGRHRMMPYDHLKPYLAAQQDLRWSYPALSNQQFAWQLQMEALAPDALAREARGQGFAAVLVDRFGYADAAQALIAQLGATPGARVAVLTDRYALLDVRSVAGTTSVSNVFAAITGTMPRCGSALRVVFDVVGSRTGGASAGADVESSTAFVVAGWAVVEGTAHAVPHLELALDGAPQPAMAGSDRPDVAAYLKTPAARRSGFTARLRTDARPGSLVRLTARGIDVGGTCYHESAPVTLVVK